MPHPDTFRIPYQLIADPHVPENFDLLSSTDDSPTDRQIEMTLSSNILDLYGTLNNHLKDTHVDITIQFPCSVPLPHETGRLGRVDNQDTSRFQHNREWIKLVGFSGYQYDPPLVTIKDLRECWPVQEDGNLKPIKVVAIPKIFINRADVVATETEEELKDRLHLMGSLYDMFYTTPEGRVVSMPTLDSKFRDRKKIYIRNYWEEFQIGVIEHFWRSNSGAALTQDDLNHLRQHCNSNKESSDWKSYKYANVSPFDGLINTNLMRDDYFRAIYVNGQPGTGKSQMLISLIYRLMQRLEKVAILYILPDMPVITILVDKSNQSNPIRVRSHPSSLEETLYTKGFPVIRIVDSVDPFANQAMCDVFTVYAASPATFQKHMEHEPRHISSWAGDYPLWSDGEFVAMMRCLGLTKDTFWNRRADLTSIVELHPSVIKLLGILGYVDNTSHASSAEDGPPDRPRFKNIQSDEKDPDPVAPCDPLLKTPQQLPLTGRDASLSHGESSNRSNNRSTAPVRISRTDIESFYAKHGIEVPSDVPLIHLMILIEE
ncbi:hypothetical protein BLNAU_16063 [Blattamonas nauphoetae]|uniref:Uncharacterized protein n=1 Tax=Blattamonas nauphoetae TaxID=2049346 RepID=A0ABQ9XE72_9EUKA|nr:hypothetical protein BLNAU_16063 [Blattamonas nauphoetae]